jgi:enoyl-CoA hydratase/carnithine racemase
MELILTGSPVTALEMERFGVVNQVMSPGEDVLEATLEIARKVASFSAPAVGLAKQAVLAGELILSKLGYPPNLIPTSRDNDFASGAGH